MRKSTPVAPISASAWGRIRPSGTGGGAVTSLVGKVLALIGVEDREPLEERDGARLVAVAFGPPAFVIRREAVGIDDGRAVLALADVAAEAQGLAEGQPALADEAVLDDRAPENQHVDAGVAALCRGVLRHGERRLRRRRPPGLDPGHAAGLQFGDDLVGDFVIEARPVLAGTGASGRVWTSRISATGAASLSRDLQPVTENPVRTLTLGGVAGCSPQKGVCRRPWRGQGEGLPLPPFPLFSKAAEP